MAVNKAHYVVWGVIRMKKAIGGRCEWTGVLAPPLGRRGARYFTRDMGC